MNRTLTACLLALSLLIPFSTTYAQSPDLPEEAFVTGVPGHAQSYKLSCESRSAADWAAYFGVDISETTFLDNLPRSDNPEKGFVGDPNDPWGNIPPYSYGVHAPAVANGLRAAGVQAEARYDLTWDDLRREIASGQPVIVWIIGGMWAGTPIRYTASDGQELTVAYFEHTMILTGYSPGTVYVIDAYSGLSQTYSLDTFLTSWSVLGNQAVIYPGEFLPPPAQERLEGETYLVQPGDYLSGISVQLDIAWQDLVEWNRLDPPYTIYAGQTLIIAPTGSSNSVDEGEEPSVEPPPAKPGIHTVAVGDTLLQIAASYGITWEKLAAINGMLYPYFIYPGQDLLLPEDVQASPSPAESQPVEQPAATTGPETYTVQPGDGLMQIARQLELDWLSLAELNGIEYPYILYPGRILRLR